MSKKKPQKNENQICKIVYFDEGSAADYIQIVNGGNLELTTESLDQSESSGGAELEAGARFGLGKAAKKLLGLEAAVSASAALETSYSSGVVATSIITNTVLTDFLSALSEDNKEIFVFVDYQIEAIPNSLSHASLLTPYLSMLRSNQGIPAGDFNISLEKLDSTLNNAKGYFEFIGNSEKEKVILRFNNTSFKNNYKTSDLSKMNLVLYAVLVGESSIADLDINNELNVEPSITQDNPDYVFTDTQPLISPDFTDLQEKLKMYDVLLAGVKSCD